MKLTNVRQRFTCCECGQQKTCGVPPYPAPLPTERDLDYQTEEQAFNDGWRAVAALNAQYGILIFRCGRPECRAAAVPTESRGRQLEPYEGPERWWERKKYQWNMPRVPPAVDEQEIQALRETLIDHAGDPDMLLKEVVLPLLREKRRAERFIRWVASWPCYMPGISNTRCTLNSGDDPEEYCAPHAAQEFLATGRWPANVEAKLPVGGPRA